MHNYTVILSIPGLLLFLLAIQFTQQQHMVTEERHIQVFLSVQTKEQKTGLPWEQRYCDNNDAIRVHCMEDTAPPLPGRHRHLVCPHWWLQLHTWGQSLEVRGQDEGWRSSLQSISTTQQEQFQVSIKWSFSNVTKLVPVLILEFAGISVPDMGSKHFIVGGFQVRLTLSLIVHLHSKGWVNWS